MMCVVKIDDEQKFMVVVYQSDLGIIKSICYGDKKKLDLFLFCKRFVLNVKERISVFLYVDILIICLKLIIGIFFFGLLCE